MPLAELFTLVIYQPFFNVLIFFYWMLGQVSPGPADMGIAVILLTILIRFLLLPISLMEDRSEEERRNIAHRIKELEVELAHDPVKLRSEVKALFKSKPRVVAGELFSLFIQVSTSLMLWRIFSSGLEGRDLHLIYSFMPQVELPFNLVFLGQFDLAHTSFFLNLLQSILIFVLETISIYTSPYPPGQGEVVRMQLVLPVVSFVIFMGLPAGKKLFVITALIFSIVVTIIKAVRRRFEAYRIEQELKEAEAAALAAAGGESEKVVVEVK
ncbi:MAG TPA: YidC/Oxa1 family membrane protein insertase [Vitreimonas sp.]|nr:YidC/Oxa1 family membrane protein insertase [Vitreimonas sp.]